MCSGCSISSCNGWTVCSRADAAKMIQIRAGSSKTRCKISTYLYIEHCRSTIDEFYSFQMHTVFLQTLISYKKLKLFSIYNLGWHHRIYIIFWTSGICFWNQYQCDVYSKYDISLLIFKHFLHGNRNSKIAANIFWIVSLNFVMSNRRIGIPYSSIWCWSIWRSKNKS